MKHATLERKLLLSSRMKGKYISRVYIVDAGYYICFCIHLPNSKHPQLPSSPPLQLLSLQECAEVIYLKWPLLFLILI